MKFKMVHCLYALCKGKWILFQWQKLRRSVTNVKQSCFLCTLWQRCDQLRNVFLTGFWYVLSQMGFGVFCLKFMLKDYLSTNI